MIRGADVVAPVKPIPERDGAGIANWRFCAVVLRETFSGPGGAIGYGRRSAISRTIRD